MSIRDRIATDLVISGFGADAQDMVDVARCAQDNGYDGVWAFDHFSGAMVARPWSREPFTVLAAMAAVTSTIRIGPLVANVVNRHPALLTSAAATLQSLAGGRVVLGLGSGASPKSRFAGEHDAIGRVLGGGEERRKALTETIECVRLLWEGGGHYEGTDFALMGLSCVVGPEPIPALIVGASGPQTLRLGCNLADGVNIRVGPHTMDLIDLAGDLTKESEFEVSVWDEFSIDTPTGGEVERWIDANVDRRTLAVSHPFDLKTIATVGAELNR